MTEAIRTAGLTKIFVSHWRRCRVAAVNGLNLSVRRGEIYGFLGPNGAGKTTTLKLLLGLLSPTSGSSTVLAEDSRGIGYRAAIGFLPENPYFYDYLTGEEFLDFYGRLFGYGVAQRRRRLDRLLTAVGLEKAAGMRLRKYSKGMLQRIGMAQALLNDPEVLILDEPQSGLDPAGRKQVRDLILQQRERGSTVLFSSHILSDAEMICDRVGIIDGGRLIAAGRLDEILETRVHLLEVRAAGIPEEGRRQVRARALSVLEAGDEVQFTLAGGIDQVPEALRLVSSSGGRLVSLVPHRETLEDAFLRRVEGRGR